MRPETRLLLVLASGLPAASAISAEAPQLDPAAYLQAFNETCRQGFPDVDAIARRAAALGWTERTMRLTAVGSGGPVSIPRAFGRGGIMLFLMRNESGTFRTICQVAGSAGTRLTGREVAAVVTPSLNAGVPEPGSGDYRKDDFATWTLEPGVTVAAGVSVYRGKVRSISMSMRQASGGEPVSSVAPPVRPSGDIPMVAIGLPFRPEAPKPVDVTHPLFGDVAGGEIQGLPGTVKSSALNFIAAAKRSSINTALAETFRRMNLLAASPGTGRKRLVVTWRGDRTPFRIGTSNSTTVTLHYRLERVDSGQVLFDREITTSAHGGGADASMRDNGIVRAAIATNFASAANCLDRAAFGIAPADCALTPIFSVSVVRSTR